MTPSPRIAPALVLALAALAPGCASLVPMSGALESLEPEDVDTVVAKVIDRYPQVGRLQASEPFVIVLDSVIIPSRGAAWTDDDARFVGATASYMLGEETGRDWVARVKGERLVMGEGGVAIAVYAEKDMGGAVLEAQGAFSLFLPVVPSGGRTGAVDALSFDLRIANQRILVPAAGATTVDLYAEIMPRAATYGEGGEVFRRWQRALFHLGWDERRGAAAGGAGGAASPERSIAAFIENARPFVGPLVRLRVRLERGADGLARFRTAVPNAVDLVLPAALVAGDRALEGAVARLSAEQPARIERRGEDLIVRVGWFFFHADATGPGAPDPEARRRAADVKGFRVPERVDAR